MLTVKLCELCPKLHQWDMYYEYDYVLALHKLFFECKTCHSWKKIVSDKELTVSDLAKMGIYIKLKEDKDD